MAVGRGGGLVRAVAAGDGNQRQTHVTDLGEQPVQRSLVGDVTLEERGSVPVVGERKPVEPGGPPLAEVPLIRIWYQSSSWPEPDIGWRVFMARTVGADVVSRLHHRW